MTEAAQKENQPPKLRRNVESVLEPNSLADLIEWFLTFDERTSRMRHAHTEELFVWKQADDAANGIGTYPFENAEARFAIGIFQALQANASEPLLGLWMNDVIAALHESKATKDEISEANNLEANPLDSAVQKAEKLTTNAEKRLYLASCWLETLCTAEARVLGWIYQEIYGRPFTPTT